MSRTKLFMDIGSSSIKWKCGEEEGRASFPRRMHNSVSEIYEVPIDTVIDTIKKTIGIFHPDEVFFTTQLQGYILSDTNHKPLSGYISWKDKRSNLLDHKINIHIGANSGTSYKYNLPVVSMLATSELMPELYNQAVYFDTLGSYIMYSLTGAGIIHITDAAASGFYNVDNGQLNISVLSEPQFRKLLFPYCVNEITCGGSYKNSMIYTSIGDCHTAAYTLDMNPDTILLNTGAAVYMSKVSDNNEKGSYDNMPFFNNQTLKTICNLPGSDIIARLNTSSAGDKEKIIMKYADAFNRLGGGRILVAIGGLAKYNSVLFEEIANRLNVKYLFIDTDSLYGLELLSEEI